ncbi:MAG: hypothetical protein K1X68_14100 [Saprospiraceae bacterium]|nr:hypothetical protein [Saprospiraceae bacterium]HMW38581.1 hypothetical protein [Saprospiraceae bacterium]HMX88782.1 hypothetical protein [Saprospiraceae bacterium]HMZ40482.1 hypothetical protein [Saprospiraceae bacterium]HNA64738.1 hypothetical protein [Saprospiraceae bacterium]
MRPLLIFIAVFFLCYIVFVFLFKNTPLSEGHMRGFAQVHNKCCQRLFQGTRLYFLPLNNKSLPCEIQGVKFSLPAGKASSEYDSKFYFVNEQKIQEQLAAANGAQVTIDLKMQNFDFTFWRGFIIAIVFWAALFCAGFSIGIRGMRSFGWSLLFIFAFCVFNYLIIVHYFRLQANQMPLHNYSAHYREIISFMYRLNGIEYLLFGAMMCYILPHFGKLTRKIHF